MRIRHLLLSSVVFGGIAVMSAASFAQTAPAVVYKPQGEWAVTRVAAKGPGKDPYCTMARRFGDNTILTFARNGKDETSLAMDFQPNTLAKGQSYYVTLSAGADEKRAFDVTPVSDKAMVIRLGQDAKFHDALNRAGALNVDVAGLQFKFEMPDMEKGHQDLGGCVTSIVEPAAGEPVTQQAASAPVPAVTPEAIINAPASAAPLGNPAPTLSETESLREENLRLKNALERERREYEDRFMKESAGSSQVSEVMEKLKLLEKENSDLKYQLADARSMQPKGKAEAPAVIAAPAVCAPTVSSEKDPAAEAELSMLREENTRLKADLAVQKTAMVELEMKASETAQGDSKKWATDTATISRLQSRVDELSAQNTKLQSDLMTAQASASAASTVNEDGSITLSQLRSVEAQLRSVENERDTLRLQIEKMGEGGEDKLLKLSGSDWNLEQATRRYNEAEREIRRLGSQLEQARTKCTAEKKEIEYMLFDPEITTKEQISKLMSLESELNEAKAELARKDTDAGGKISEYEQKIAALEGELQAAKQGTTDAEGLRAQITQAQADKKQLEQRVAQLEQDRAGGSVSVNENLALKDRIAILEGEKSALEQKLASSISPAAGTPTAPIQEQVVAAVSTQSPAAQPVVPAPSKTVASADGRMPGSVSTEPLDDSVYGGPVALSPKSVTPTNSFVSTQQAVVAAVPSAAPVAVQAAPVSLITADALAGQLRQAGLNLTSGIKKIEKASGPSSVAYSWDMGGLFGSAEQAPMQNPEQFKTLISKYLDKTKSRCAGDFAASPVPVEKSGSVLVESYEIACIGADGNGATAALAFYGQGGVFTTVAHEAGMDSMDLAMDARDRVIASVSGGTVKAN